MKLSKFDYYLARHLQQTCQTPEQIVGRFVHSIMLSDGEYVLDWQKKFKARDMMHLAV